MSSTVVDDAFSGLGKIARAFEVRPDSALAANNAQRTQREPVGRGLMQCCDMTTLSLGSRVPMLLRALRGEHREPRGRPACRRRLVHRRRDFCFPTSLSARQRARGDHMQSFKHTMRARVSIVRTGTRRTRVSEMRLLARTDRLLRWKESGGPVGPMMQRRNRRHHFRWSG
jgi:hypothetical protein